MRFAPSIVLVLCCAVVGLADEPWARHTIDAFDETAGKSGADGVRLADVNGDGRLDVTTGWEQGGAVRVCINPGPAGAKKVWPSVTVGQVKGVEDAAFADLDGNGVVDVISCAEGAVNSVFIHWAPPAESYRNPKAWKTDHLPTSEGRRWMYALPLDVNGDGRLDIVAGSKNERAVIGWFEQPANPRDADSWKLHSMTDVSWVMSMRAIDIDGDNEMEILYSDRWGHDGVYWLERPADVRARWTRHLVGGHGKQVMFLDVGDLNGDSHDDVACATLEGELLTFLRDSNGWRPSQRPLPFGLTAGKGVTIADVNLDGVADIVTTSEAQREADEMISVAWIEQKSDGSWTAHRISDQRGRKFDRIEMLDLDNDGDLDLLTCEEVHNLGVFWYENPTR